MKRTLFCYVCLLTLSASLLAQSSESFDIATFQTPPGWTKQNKEGVTLLSRSDSTKGTFAMITMYASGQANTTRRAVQHPNVIYQRVVLQADLGEQSGDRAANVIPAAIGM